MVTYQQNCRDKRKGKPLPKINQASDQREKLYKIYKILCAILKPLHPKCEGKLPGCTHKASEIHHSKGRRGFLLILSRYFKYMCHNCHSFCTENSAEAIELELSYRRNSPTEWDFTEKELELIQKHNLKLPKYIH